MQPKMSKTQVAIQAFQKGDIKTALYLSSQFKIGVSKEDAKVLKTGYECLVHPEFYKQLGKDVGDCIAKAQDVFAGLFART